MLMQLTRTFVDVPNDDTIPKMPNEDGAIMRMMESLPELAKATRETVEFYKGADAFGEKYMSKDAKEAKYLADIAYKKQKNAENNYNINHANVPGTTTGPYQNEAWWVFKSQRPDVAARTEAEPSRVVRHRRQSATAAVMHVLNPDE